MANNIAHERLLELLDYDPVTGVFTRKTSYSNVHAGQVAGSRVKVGGKNRWIIHIEVDGGRYQAHRLAWFYVYGEWPSGNLDHRDTDSTNNAILNLRPADRYQNGYNMKLMKSNTSGVKGVNWDRTREQWVARSRVDGKKVLVGRFDDLDAAAEAMRKFREVHHGEFANHG